MATYKGAWYVQRYWFTEWRGGRAHRQESSRIGKLTGGNVGACGMYEANKYVGMWFPVDSYPTEEHLPIRREEIAIWPTL